MITVKLNEPTIYETEGVKLFAGENEITKAQLEKLMKNKIVAADFERGLLSVVEEKQPAKKEKTK